jgi:hypothetical protein
MLLDVLHVLSVSQSLHVVLNRNRSKFKENHAQTKENQGKEVKPFWRLPLILITTSAKLTFISIRPYLP